MQFTIYFIIYTVLAFLPCHTIADELEKNASDQISQVDARPFESKAQLLEAVLVGGAILFLLGLNHYHHRSGRKSASRRGGKLGFDQFALPLETKLATSRALSVRRSNGGANDKASVVGRHGGRPMGRTLGSEKELTAALEKSKDSQEKVRMSDELLALARKGDMENATKLLRQKEERFGKLPLPDYTCVITMCAKCNDPIGALRWLRRVQEAGLQANQICYNAVINAFAKMGDLDQAFALAKDMKNIGLEFDTVTYNTFIDASARAGDAKSAQQWMQGMLDAGVKASVVSFGSVMRACAQAGHTEELEHWVQQAHNLGIQLNAICFNAVIRAFVHNEDLATATAWLLRMIEMNVPPSMLCFLAVVDALLDKGDVKRAAEVIEKIRESQLEPDPGTFSTAVVAACRAGVYDLAQKWASQAIAHGRRLSKSAERALIASNLQIPERGSSAVIEAIVKPQVVQEHGGDDTTVSDAVKWTRQNCVGKRFVGTIKEFISFKFGHIICEDTYAVFKRDVFLCAQDNPEQLGRGQRVEFTLQIEKRSGLPRAYDIRAFTPNS